MFSLVWTLLVTTSTPGSPMHSPHTVRGWGMFGLGRRGLYKHKDWMSHHSGCLPAMELRHLSSSPYLSVGLNYHGCCQRRQSRGSCGGYFQQARGNSAAHPAAVVPSCATVAILLPSPLKSHPVKCAKCLSAAVVTGSAVDAAAAEHPFSDTPPNPPPSIYQWN